MGILTRKQGDVFVITSDRPSGASRTNRAPHRLAETYEVWTGTGWSPTIADAISFTSLDAADDYVRMNFAQVNG
jgi:hypothetical protein